MHDGSEAAGRGFGKTPKRPDGEQRSKTAPAAQARNPAAEIPNRTVAVTATVRFGISGGAKRNLTGPRRFCYSFPGNGRPIRAPAEKYRQP